MVMMKIETLGHPFILLHCYIFEEESCVFWGLKRKKRVLGSTKQEEAKEDLRKTKFLLVSVLSNIKL